MTTDRDTLLRIADELKGCVSPSGADVAWMASSLRAIASRLPGPYSPEPPREPGWYWWKDKRGHEPFPTLVFKRGEALFVEAIGEPLRVAGIGGEWSGPIPQNDEVGR